jgi:phosphoglycerol transferase MdoB-like AlkP superfamily enzyme
MTYPPPARLSPHAFTGAAHALASAALVLLALAWLDPALPWPPSTWTAEGFARLLLNAIPGLALLLLLLAITRRLWLAAGLVLVAVWALYAANVAKLSQLGTPLIPADLRLLIDLGPSLQLFRHYVRFDGTAGLEVAAALLASAFLFRAVRPTITKHRARHLFIVGVFAALTLVRGAPPWRWLYDADRLGFQPWSITDSVARVGLIGTLLLYEWDYGARDVPKGDIDAAKELLRAHAPALEARFAAIGTDEPPDIIVVQSESFFDPARMREVADGQYLDAFHRWAGGAESGNLVVPSFGGGTIRTEFEVLTGAPLGSLEGVQYPWLEIDRRELEALPRTLARQGYRTLAIHPNAGAFWNRTRTYPALGFDRFIDGDAFPEETVVGLFPGDAALTDRILAELDDDGPPQLVFAVSMEAHGPFDWRPNLDEDRLAAIPLPEALDEGGRYWLRNYLYLLGDADRSLDRLATALAKRGRRSVLLFYGDHLPALPPVYAQLGFDDDGEAEHQPVPWLLFDTASSHAKHLDTQAWLLPAILLNEAGVADASYFTILDVLRTELDLDRHPEAIEEIPGLRALARLSLRGELDAVLADVLSTAPSNTGG